MRIRRSFRFACLSMLMLLLVGCSAPKLPSSTGGEPASNPAGSTGSKSIDTPQVAMGRYVERPVGEATLPEHSRGQILHQIGAKTYALGLEGKTVVVSEDLANWTEESTGYAGPEPDFMLDDFTVTQDGSFYFLSSRYANGAITTMLQRVQNESTATVEVGKIDGGVPILRSIQPLASGNLLASTRNDGILQIAPDGSIAAQYQVAQSYVSIDVHGDELAVYDGNTIVIANLADGAVLRTLPIEAPDQRMSGYLRYDDQGALYFANNAGIYRVNPGGTLLERIVDGALCSLSDPTAYPDQLVFDSKKRPTMPYLRYPKTQFIAYEFDAAVPTEPNIALNLFSISDNRVMQKAILMYQSAHPDVMVRWTVAIPRDSSITVDDAIRTLNTEVLAGKGPDLFVLDDLPIEAYTRKGVLADLSGVLQPLIDQGAVFTAITDAFLRDGKRCALPTRFALPTLWGDVDGVSSLADLAERAQADPEIQPFGDMTPAGLIAEFLPASLPAWKGDDGQLIPERVADFLAQMRGIIGGWTPDGVRAVVPGGANAETGITLLTHEKVAFASFTLNGARAVANGKGALYTAQKGGFMALPGQASGVYIPRAILGVNAAAARPELCTAFVETILGEELQGLDLFNDDFPVRKASFDALMAEEAAQTGTIGVTSAMDSDLTSMFVAPDAEMVKQVRGMADLATVCSLPDPTLLGLLIEETKPFFADAITAEDAARNFVSRANAYVTE